MAKNADIGDLPADATRPSDASSPPNHTPDKPPTGPDPAGSTLADGHQANSEALCLKAIDLAESTLNRSFEVARRILVLKDPNAAVELQLAHARSQIAAYDAHIREVGRLTRAKPNK